jgi:hypothetical protein
MGKWTLIIACLVVAASSAAYLICGFNFVVFTAWLVGLALGGSSFMTKVAPPQIRFNRADLLVALALVLVALPLYLWSIYTVPFQLNADELVIIDYEREWVNKGVTDVFGLSPYFGFMYCPFLVQGWLAKALGGIDLYHLRLLHGLDGVLIVALSFLFFRVLGMNRLMATSAAIFMCVNHAFLAMSRIASRINSGVLCELLALTALFDGFRRKCPLTMYIGGVLTGFCFYVYYSARMAFLDWMAFLLLVALCRRQSYPIKQLIKLTAIFFFGFALSTAPFAVANIRESSLAASGIDYQRRTCLLYPEGRKLTAQWLGKADVAEGVKQNIIDGMTAFNNNIPDRGAIYYNANHGFVDPLSGILVWLGYLRVLIYFRSELGALFMLCSLMVELLCFSFITGQCPNFGRMLIILPFVGYFVAYGIEGLSSLVARLVKKLKLPKLTALLNQDKFQIPILFPVCLAAIVAWNFNILFDFFQRGLVHGDDLGGPARYVESRKGDPDHLFIIAASPKFQFFSWQNIFALTARLKTFLSAEQDNKLMVPDDLGAVKIVPPFSIFMNGELWELKRSQLQKMYPHLIVHKISDDRKLVAIEDPDSESDSHRIHMLYRGWVDFPTKVHNELWAGHQKEVVRMCLEALKDPTFAVNGSYFKSGILIYLADAYSNLGEYEKAEPLLKEVLAIREEMVGPDEDGTAEAINALGDLYMRQQRWDKAEIWYRKALKIKQANQENNGEVSSGDTAHACRMVGQTLWKQGKYSEAEKLLQRAYSLCGEGAWDKQEQAAIASDLSACQADHQAHPKR